MQDDTDK